MTITFSLKILDVKRQWHNITLVLKDHLEYLPSKNILQE